MVIRTDYNEAHNKLDEIISSKEHDLSLLKLRSMYLRDLIYNQTYLFKLDDGNEIIGRVAGYESFSFYIILKMYADKDYVCSNSTYILDQINILSFMNWNDCDPALIINYRWISDEFKKKIFNT